MLSRHKNPTRNAKTNRDIGALHSATLSSRTRERMDKKAQPYPFTSKPNFPLTSKKVTKSIFNENRNASVTDSIEKEKKDLKRALRTYLNQTGPGDYELSG